MKIINKTAVFVASGLFLLVAILVPLSRVSAQLIEKPEETVQEAPAEQKQEQQAENTYSYVAQPGDSYSLIARKAVQTYGIINKVDLSEAQIIFAETNLTQQAGSPVLNLGQKVDVQENQVKQWADSAKELSAEKQAAWDVYAQHADFNTDNVGQSS